MNTALLPATRPGKRKKPDDPSSQADIRKAVDALIQTDFSNIRIVVLELLYQFVCLSESALFQAVRSQVAFSDNPASFSRTLRRYRQQGLIKPVRYDVIKKVQRAGLPNVDGRVMAYTLGPVGEEYAKQKGLNMDGAKEAPFQSLPDDDYMAHDLICSEAMFKMQRLWAELPDDKRGVTDVFGPRSVLIWDTDGKREVVKPDGLLVKRKPAGEFERAFLVEYQNVRALVQVQKKIKKYEEIAKPEYRWVWDLWGLDEMPWVLVIYRQESTFHHYQEQLESRGETRAKYASSSLLDIWDGKLSIKAIKK